MDHAAGRIDLADADIPPLPFEEAVSFMKGRVPLTKTEWNALESKLRFRAFTVARLAQCDDIEAVREKLVSALQDGKGYAAHWRDIKAIAEEDGAYPWKPGYWENVFRTNTQTAYIAGKLMRYQKNPPPAWRLMVIDDDRTSGICRALIQEGKNGLVLPSSHKFWSVYGFPPYHFQCRTGLQAIYQYQIGHGVEVENPSMKSLRRNFHPQKGLGGNPIEKESWWKITPEMVSRAENYGILKDLPRQAYDMDMISYEKELLTGKYTRIYEGKKGGYVEAASNWEYSQKEENAAKELADEGHQIYFLPRTRNAKSADMIIDNQIGEIKHQTEKGFKSLRDELLKAGAEQRARTVVMYPLDSTTKEEIELGLWRAINRTPVKTVILKWRGKRWNLPRKLIMNKGWKLP
jgi:hypothetical protein